MTSEPTPPTTDHTSSESETSLAEAIRRLETEQSLADAIRRLDQANYEKRASIYARRQLRSVLGLTKATAIATPDNKNRIYEIAEAATITGSISAEEVDDLVTADMIFTATDPNGVTVHVVAEAPITANDHDCKQTIRRAAIMNRATKKKTLPVVTTTEAPTNLIQKHQHEVQIINIPHKRID